MNKLVMLLAIILVALPLCAQKEAVEALACPSTHTVSLTCQGSTSAGVTGYHFYRGTKPGGENYAASLNATQVKSCAFTDTTACGSETYYYTAKATCTTCSPILSTPSNEVVAVIVADPQAQPPVALQVSGETVPQVESKIPQSLQRPIPFP